MEKKNEPFINDGIQKRDFIICHDRFERAVVACMHHCPYPDYCNNFYNFWKSQNELPIAYYNKDGIGEKVMRRIVIDCDRCGKKDVTPFYSRYTREGESQEYLQGAKERREMIENSGYPAETIGEVVFSILQKLETDRQWLHYCEKCFSKIVESVATIYEERKMSAKESPTEKKAEVREISKKVKATA